MSVCEGGNVSPCSLVNGATCPLGHCWTGAVGVYHFGWLLGGLRTTGGQVTRFLVLLQRRIRQAEAAQCGPLAEVARDVVQQRRVGVRDRVELTPRQRP